MHPYFAHRSLTALRAMTLTALVDALHKACLLWQSDLQDEVSALIASHSGEMWPVAQAIIELLP